MLFEKYIKMYTALTLDLIKNNNNLYYLKKNMYTFNLPLSVFKSLVRSENA